MRFAAKPVGVFLAVVVFALAVDALDGEPQEPTSPAPGLVKPTAPSRPAGWFWRVVDVRCADGWPSQSIGRQGACSWHGGVVTVWRNDVRGLTVACHDGYPPDFTTAVEQAREYGRLLCLGGSRGFRLTA